MRYLLVMALALLSLPALAQSVVVMSFNAENLFDTVDDPDNLGDDMYLPLAEKDRRGASHGAACDKYYDGYPAFVMQCKVLDWNDEVYATKLERLANVIQSMVVLPDVIVLQEVENRRVLNDLVTGHFPDAGYRVIQLDTSDKVSNRGIDVGIVTRLGSAGRPEAHRMTFAGGDVECGTGRDIVLAPLSLPDGETLQLFGVHFSPGVKRFPCRVREFEKLNELASALPSGSLAIAAGDFNISCRESGDEIVSKLLEEGEWYVSPLVRHGCSAPGSFRDPGLSPDRPDAWSFLDMIIVSAALSPTMPTTKNWFADLGSFGTVVVNREQVRVDDEDRGFVLPQWFDPSTGRGVSDHFPVSLRLLTRRN